ncbi:MULTISPECIES: hypothetical protein [unclassified Microcoleus]|uniref:hypothetical protein n=1 Tax=unclassified Microcoleus TaxID=2642155 RepID=UPI002FD05423
MFYSLSPVSVKPASAPDTAMPFPYGYYVQLSRRAIVLFAVRSTYQTSQIKNLKSIDGGPPKPLRYEIKVALLAEEAARVARKSSCTAQSCYQQQWTA